jgi:hypothetical protein
MNPEAPSRQKERGARLMEPATMNITISLPSEAAALTEIAFAAKRHWGYPEHWIAHWRSILTVTPEFVATHETY